MRESVIPHTSYLIPHPSSLIPHPSYLTKATLLAGHLHGFAPEAVMLLTIAIVCLVLWILGFMTTSTLGGALHVLLVVAIVLFLVHIIQGSSIGNA